jgi:ankyrin repeat protein
MWRFEQRETPLDFAIRRKRYDIVDLLIDLGIDLEAEDQSGQSPLAAAMLRGDREAMPPARPPESIKTGVPMIFVPDVARALNW